MITPVSNRPESFATLVSRHACSTCRYRFRFDVVAPSERLNGFRTQYNPRGVGAGCREEERANTTYMTGWP